MARDEDSRGSGPRTLRERLMSRGMKEHDSSLPMAAKAPPKA